MDNLEIYNQYKRNGGKLDFDGWTQKFISGMKKYKVYVTLYEGKIEVHTTKSRTAKDAIDEIKLLYYGTSWQTTNKYKAELEV